VDKMVKAEQFREKLLVIDFVAFGKQDTKFFFDTEVEQASKLIWRTICPTAVILYAWEYCLGESKQCSIDKKKLTDDELEKVYKKL
jgi:hypothetical protein